MKGNDFNQNPGGSQSGGGGGQPTPRAAGGGQPSSYGQSRPQSPGSDPVNPNEIPAGGKDLYADAKPGDAGNPIGTGSIGDSSKPYKLGGS